MVDASPFGDGPASSTTSTLSPSIPSASEASVAAGSPLRFAELTAIGPVRSSSASATSWSGIRTATVPLVSPRSQVSDGCCSQTSVSGPGQKASVRASTYGWTFVARAASVVAALIRTGGGISRPRPLASRSACTAAWSKASAPMPYTVSVGSTTRPPRCTACAAASIAVSRSSAVEVGYVVLIDALARRGPGRPWAGWRSSCQSRGEEPRTPGKVLAVPHLVPAPGVGEDGRSRLPLGVRVLDADDTAGPEQEGRPPLDDADRVEPVAGRVER